MMMNASLSVLEDIVRLRDASSHPLISFPNVGHTDGRMYEWVCVLFVYVWCVWRVPPLDI